MGRAAREGSVAEAFVTTREPALPLGCEVSERSPPLRQVLASETNARATGAIRRERIGDARDAEL